MSVEQGQWLVINDFSPGIRHRSLSSAVSSAPQILGAAEANNTYRCIALPGGGLGPLPKRTGSINAPDIEGLAASRLMSGVYFIVGFHVTGPVTWRQLGGETPLEDMYEIHIAYEWGFDSDSNGSFDKRKFRWDRIRGGNLAINTVLTETVDDVVQGVSVGNPRGAFFVDGRMANSDATAAGEVIVACSWYANVEFSGVSLNGVLFPLRVWSAFPDPAAPTALGVHDISIYRLGSLQIQHQGRLVLTEESITVGAKGQGATFAQALANEDLIYTDVNLKTTIDSYTTDPPVSFGQGQYSGYGAAYSVSAQELLLIHHRGGAIAISGDLDNPTVTTLSGVMSTYGAVTVGTPSPLGFIYAVNGGGVYAWQGGDRSENISPYLEDEFWKLSSGIFLYDGKFDLWNDWVLAPNNWLFDTITKSWWRLDDINDVQILHWGVSPFGHTAFGAKKSYTPSALPAIYTWDRNTPTTSYRWQSQIITDTIDKVVNIRQAVIHATGPASSTITITLLNETGDTQSKEITLTSATHPKAYVTDFSFIGSSIRVRIDAAGTVAPNLWDIKLNYQDGQHEAKS